MRWMRARVALCVSPDGWRVVAYAADSVMQLPQSVAARLERLGLASAANHFSIYQLPREGGMQSYRVVCSAPATGEAVSLADAKAYLRVDGSDEDALINRALAAARMWIEQRVGATLVNQEYRLETQVYEAPEYVDLPFGPVTQIVSVQALDAANAATTVAASAYQLREGADRLIAENWPLHRRFRVVYRGGYGVAGYPLPQPLQQAILRLSAAFYEGEAALDSLAIPALVEALILPYRRVRL